MSKQLESLLEKAKGRHMTASEHEAQRRSFAYGNTHFENERITKETVNRAAEDLKTSNAKDGSPER